MKVGKKYFVWELSKNDLFLYEYGYSTQKFRVNESFGEAGVMTHSTRWCKSDSMFIEPNTEVRYVGKVTWVRSLFMI